MGYSLGITPIVGYHYGAKNKYELKSLLKKSCLIILSSALVLTGLAELTFLKNFCLPNNNDISSTFNI